MSCKLEAILTPEAVRRLRDKEGTVLGATARDTGPVSLLLKAVTDRCVVHLVYRGLARGEPTRREIEPLGLCLAAPQFKAARRTFSPLASTTRASMAHASGRWTRHSDRRPRRARG